MNTLSRDNLIERSQHPLYAGPLDTYSHSVEGANLSCGDELSWQLLIDETGTIRSIAHVSRACSVCVASADLLAERLIGSKISDIEKESAETIQEHLGIPLSPTRLKCALLPLTTLKSLK